MEWILYCPQCAEVAMRSHISESDLGGFDAYTNLCKPMLPDGGLIVLCPNCGETSVHQRYQLVFRKA